MKLRSLSSLGIVLVIVLTANAPVNRLPVGKAEALTTPALLDTLQHTSFDYFWNEANPSNGLIKDRSTTYSPCSIASTGFGLSAICIGVDHGWVSRSAAAGRVLTTLNTFWTGPQGTAASGIIGYKGLFYHFLDMNTATRTWDCELSTIDTALLMAGILDAKQYFNGLDATETQIRALADSIYYRCDWDWVRNSTPGIMMGWKPGTGFSGYGYWTGYNEAMILYLLALGSPTHPIPASAWSTWTSGYVYHWGTQYGYTYLTFPPLFGHQYTHCWVDFRNIHDSYMAGKGITYFENSRRATLAARAYCIANPGGFSGYGADLWGLTACDGPSGYNARGAPPSQNDDGTIAPTAAASSIVFAPDEVIPTLQYMYDNLSAGLWGPYGFRDAFNLTQFWWDTDYIGIDEGPIILMIENYRTGSVWRRMMANADLQQGLAQAGFYAVTGVGDGGGVAGARPEMLLQNAPNPFRTSTRISFHLDRGGEVSLALYDVAGREVRRLIDGYREAGAHDLTLDAAGLPSGIYLYRLKTEEGDLTRRCIVLR